MSTSPHLMVVELNEFAPDYVSEMASTMALPNLQRVVCYPHAHTVTADRAEHQAGPMGAMGWNSLRQADQRA